jgi:methylthioribulose-1-phosphate dehydratase
MNAHLTAPSERGAEAAQSAAQTRFAPAKFAECAAIIAEAGKELYALGWTPATSSNFSMRIDAEHLAITVSGRHKGRLTPDDVMLIDLHGNALGTTLKPSAETLLHTQIYQRFPETGAVLHTHSRAQTLASKLFEDQGCIVFEDYELLKAFAGTSTHDIRMEVPVFSNTQDMPALVQEINVSLDRKALSHGYLIEGHGIYTWGRSMDEARRHLDAFEFLLQCELELIKLRGGLA